MISERSIKKSSEARISKSICFSFLLKTIFGSFLKDIGISFQSFVPILENELTRIDSLDHLIQLSSLDYDNQLVIYIPNYNKGIKIPKKTENCFSWRLCRKKIYLKL